MVVRLLTGDCRDVLATLKPGSVQACVTSPPYFQLRDYNVPGQIGLEPDVSAYVAALVDVFREVRRVLRDDGTLWLNLGSSYGPDKQLIPVPWLVALALQADGWVLRADVIWAKPNPMPESVSDRPTKSHEYLLLLSKNARYYYDAAAIREPHITESNIRKKADETWGAGATRTPISGGEREWNHPDGRNRRSVWTVSTRPFSGAHFATFPPALIEPCIKAGSREGDTVLDPFGGAGTTGLVADRLGRDAILIELNAEYAAMARRRIAADAPLFAVVS